MTLISNGSTGFLWSDAAQLSDPLVLSQSSHQYVPPLGGADGAAGKEVWTFEALKKGTCTIHLEYSQSWVGGEKAHWTFDLDVSVK